MTIQYATDNDAIENAIVKWLRTYDNENENVIYANQMAVRPETPFATYQIIADGALDGVDAEHQEFNDITGRLDTVTYGPRRMTVQIVIFTVPGSEDVAGRSARMRMNRTLAVLRNQTVMNSFHDAGMSFLQILSPPSQADEQLGDRWERRMMADLEFGYTSLVTDIAPEDDGSWIETADPISVTYLE